MNAFRSAAGLIAALVVASLGFLMLGGSRLPRVGLALFAVGAVIALWQAWRAFAAQRDRERYDLSRLWERMPEPPEESEEADESDALDDDTLYCHSCGHAVPRAWHHCPDCGRPLS